MNCENCKKELEPNDSIFTIDGLKEVCYECAEKMALDAQKEGRDIEIYSDYHNYFLCQWCEELFSENDLMRELDIGYLCEHCIEAIHSRGEKLFIEY